MDDYTGIWIPPRNFYPFTIIACENLSDNTKYSVYPTLQCSLIDPWMEATNKYIVHDDWITNDFESIKNEGNSRLFGKYNVDGEIEWFNRSPNGYERVGKWQRPNVRDYIGIWEQRSERSKEFIDIYCNNTFLENSEEQLKCILRNSEEGKVLTFTVNGTSITYNANSSLLGKFNRDGSISWFLDTNYFLTWRRKGKFLEYLWNRVMKLSKIIFIQS